MTFKSATRSKAPISAKIGRKHFLTLIPLVNAGFDVVRAESSKEGIEIFRAEKVDLVIVDIWMPEKDGLETIMDIRRSFREARIIAITGGGRLGLMNPLN